MAHKYNIIIKCVQNESTDYHEPGWDLTAMMNEHLVAWLGYATLDRAVPLGYDEVIATIRVDDSIGPELTRIHLAEWLRMTRPETGDPFEDGALLWYE